MDLTDEQPGAADVRQVSMNTFLLKITDDQVNMRCSEKGTRL